MRNDFAILILTHGRAGNILTLDALKKARYTGAWFMVLDDEDSQLNDYQELYGKEHCYVFSKAEVAKTTDAGDNLPGRTAILWARNASFAIAMMI